MKVLKWIGIILLSLIVILFVAALILPKDANVQAEITINAPVETVYNNIADFKQWEKWSAWKEMDTASKETYFGNTGQVGSGYTWVGQKTGEGKVTASVIKPNEEFGTDLEFIKPMEGKADADFKFSTQDGATKVVWTYHAKQAIPMNVMAFMMKGMLKQSFDRGLEKLKALSETQGAAAPSYTVTETHLPETHYLMVRKQLKWNEITSDLYANGYAKIAKAIGQNKLTAAGAPSGLSFAWDVQAQTADLGIAMPVSTPGKTKDDVLAYTMPATKAFTVDYYGAYEKVQAGYDAIEAAIKQKGLKVKYPAVEQYITDPMQEPDTAKWLTKIYMPVQ